MKALSIRNPWAWSIARGYKKIENRTWDTSFRGTFLVHASLAMSRNEYEEWLDVVKNIPETMAAIRRQGGVTFQALKEQSGGIIAVADLVDVVTQSDDPWFFGPYGFVLENVRPVPFMPLKGALGFFNVNYPVKD